MPSSVKHLQFQPIRFDFEEQECVNPDDTAYCALVADGDDIRVQIPRTLGTSVGCALTDVDATQLLDNSGFTGAAAPEWTLSGGWTYGADAVSNAGGNGAVSQTYAAMADDTWYKIVVTTTVTTTGADLEIFLSGTVRGVIPEDSPAGTYTFYFLSDTGVSSTVGVQGTGITTTVTSIEMYTAAPCYTFDLVEGTITYDEVLGLIVNGTVIITVTAVFEPSSQYSPRSTLTIANLQSGTINFGYDGSVSGPLDASNGSFEWTMNGDNHTTLGITLTDFVGSVTEIEIDQLSSDYFFALYDLDGNWVQSLNNYVEYCNEYVNLRFNPFEEGFAYGCYRIGMYDPFLHDDHLALEYDYDDFTAWTSTGNTWTLGAPAEFDAVGNTNASIVESETAAATFEVAWVKFRLETGTQTGPGIGGSSIQISIVDDSVPTTIAASSSSSAGPPTITRSASEGDTLTTYSTALEPRVDITGALATDHYEIVNAYYKIYPFHRDYLSNCFNYAESHDCTKFIYADPGDNLGFKTTNCTFSIQSRFRIVRITPQYKIAASDFISSDGTRLLISGTMQKFYVLLFDRMDEIAHDVVAGMIMCQEVRIDDTALGASTTGKRYFILPQTYTPEYVDKNGQYNLSQGRIEILEYDQVKFTTNCGN